MKATHRIEKAARAAVAHAWIEESAAFTEWNQFYAARNAALRAIKRELGVVGRAPASVFNAANKYAERSIFEMVHNNGTIELNFAGAGKDLAHKIKRLKRRMRRGTL